MTRRPQWQLDAIACELKRNPEELLFMGLPERWHRTPTWKCGNGHLFKTTKTGICLKCPEWLWLTFPEDTEVEDTDLPPGANW